VWAYDANASTIDLAYDDSLVIGGAAPLTGVDNVTGAANGDLFVAEDGGDMEICMITPAGVVAPFLRVLGQGGSEITGPAFSPDGSRLYFSSQRGTSGDVFGGITYEVRGPFRG
jgi:secreted PhoX family phosphatase